LYGFLYSRFSRFEVITRPADHHEDNFENDEDDLENDESDSVNAEGDLENDEDDGNVRSLETIEPEMTLSMLMVVCLVCDVCDDKLLRSFKWWNRGGSDRISPASSSQIFIFWS